MTARLLALALCVGCADDPAVLVLSAASTGDVASATARDETEAGRVTTTSVAASSVLARQIAQGAPADVFVSADPAWVDWLASEDVAVLDRRPVATGRLVVVGPLRAQPGRLGDVLAHADRVALADPEHVPAGRYARQALRRAGLWTEVEPRVVRVGDVRAALAAVETGVADRAVVYASDAAASRRARVLADVPHARVVFEAALLSARGRPAFDRLTRASGDRWARAGFGPAPR